jgi:hypothetical protein
VTSERIALVLTALAAIVIVLTRVRMRDEAAGRLAISHALINVHTLAGVLALASWLWFLLGNADWMFGFGGLALWWVTAVAGLLILARWLPARGKHASGPAADTWGEGPGLSILGHVGLLVGCVVWSGLFFAGNLS